jgi:hypothetical protein
MTVNELMVELSTLDPKMEVVVGPWCDSIEMVEVLEDLLNTPAQVLLELKEE